MSLDAGEVRRIGGHPVGGGSAFDIWEGEYLGKEKCALKILRGVEVSDRTQIVSVHCYIYLPSNLNDFIYAAL